MTLDKHLNKPIRKSIDKIIDNRTQTLKDVIKRILPKTQLVKFAVGYFYLSGFDLLKKELSKLDEIYILMGNITDPRTIEQIALGYHKLDAIKGQIKDEKFLNARDRESKKNEISIQISESLSYLDQDDDNEKYIQTLGEMIEKNRVHIRVYTKGTLHAKAYLFSLRDQSIHKGYALVGSSNLSLSGIENNTELNLFLPDSQVFDGLDDWFNELWDESVEFNEELMDVLKKSWVLNTISPYDLYIKTLYEILRTKSEVDEDYLLYYDKKFPELLEFQEVAFKQAVKILEKYNGVFIADVVGLGKTFIGTALLKYYQLKYHTSALIICRPALKDMWDYFKNRYGLSATIITTGDISKTVENSNGERVSKFSGFETDPQYQYIDIVLIDESHNFRNSDTVRYEVVAPFTQDRKVVLLTATPQNNSPWDIYNQIKLFHPNDETLIPIETGNLRNYFNEITKCKFEFMDEVSKSQRSIKIQSLLRHILIRRPRSHIEQYYAEEDSRGQKFLMMKRENQIIKAYFPKRKLTTWSYVIDEIYGGIYDLIYDIIGHKRNDETPAGEYSITYAYYSLGNYLKSEIKYDESKKKYRNLGNAGKNLRGIIRTLLFKRLESSVYAFTQTLQKIISSYKVFVKALDEEKILAGKLNRKLLLKILQKIGDGAFDDLEISNELNDKLAVYSQIVYDINDFDIKKLKIDLESDIEKLEIVNKVVGNISPIQDNKLRKLECELKDQFFQNSNRKILIFTQYRDTAIYLDKNLKIFNSDIKIQIDSSTTNKNRIIGRFAPKSNPEIINQMKREGRQIEPIKVIISTDVLSEGLNLQDCDTVINYDLHWNPVRLIQRIGRIDRIGTTATEINVFNFLPEKGIEKRLGLKEKLHQRIQEIQDVIGEDSEILDHTEKVNKNAIYVIYNGTPNEQDDLLNSVEDELLFGLNEAEELLRRLERENKEYIEYIASLPTGLRSGKINKNSLNDEFFACFQSGPFVKCYLLDENKKIITSDLIRCLNAIKSTELDLPVKIPDAYNQFINVLNNHFKKELKDEKEHLRSVSKISNIQRDISDYLFSECDKLGDSLAISKVRSMSKLFEITLPNRIIKQIKNVYKNRENLLELIEELVQIYTKNRIQDYENKDKKLDQYDLSKIVTSMLIQKG
ncbi:MAG: DEAD/DEAH box helicase family protein [Candidatus Delongbacteria bacterium]|nr:DEAD/DEAH box helicase family protein [Candidatus Delongbacteria bacterium]